jgi:L-fuculose-phosphate aldolase
VRNGEVKQIELTGLNVLAMRDAQSAHAAGATHVRVCERCVITPSARDFLRQNDIELVFGGAAAVAATASSQGSAASSAPAAVSAAKTHSPADPRLFSTPEAEAVKKEICAVGRKLWNRSYVDGNGGNISYRIGPNEVICTPTLMSKLDLTPEDLCLVDLDGVQVAGKRPRTSEIFLHLEIYKAVPEAKSAVHCHPPHATAYAITGRVPPNRIIPEFEVFVGKVAVSPYETPGTAAFAQTVLPYVREHNTVLLSNHGIICWADTVTHAEWYAEVVDTYCWTLMNASMLGVPISQISEQHTTDLLNIKKKLGLPDSRFDTTGIKECQLSDMEVPHSIALLPCTKDGSTLLSADAPELDRLVKTVTDAVMNAMNAS